MTIDGIADALKAGNAKMIRELTEQALAEGLAPADIICNEIYVRRCWSGPGPCTPPWGSSSPGLN